MRSQLKRAVRSGRRQNESESEPKLLQPIHTHTPTNPGGSALRSGCDQACAYAHRGGGAGGWARSSEATF